jgi:hypothetical protein
VEVCDGIDNNCGGAVDEGFDLQSDPNNCGVCGNSCAGGVCQAGSCVCTPSTEVCNGIDDDCDGVVDNEGACP